MIVFIVNSLYFFLVYASRFIVDPVRFSLPDLPFNEFLKVIRLVDVPVNIEDSTRA